MDDTAKKIITQTLSIEGGYVSKNDSVDKHETYRGINRDFSKDWDGWVTVDSNKPLKYNYIIQSLEDNVREWYYENFYLKYKCDEINCAMISGHLFDACVNSGANGVRTLQNAINEVIGNGTITVDGSVGAQTLSYCNNESYTDLIASKFPEFRINYYKSCSLWNKCYKSWTKRVNDMTELCQNI